MTDQTHTPPTFLTDLFGWHSMTMLALGSRTGLLDALADGGTVEEIGARAGVDRRNAWEWLRAMTAARHAEMSGDRFRLTDETAMVFGPGFPVDARAVVDFVAGVSSVFASVVDAVSTGRGVDSGTYEQAFGSAVSAINTPTYLAALVTEWLPMVDGLVDTLSAGGSAADLACGRGDAAAVIARAFPDASVIGFDLNPGTVGDDVPDNLELRMADATNLPRDHQFDVVLCLDSFHHFGDPVRVASEVLAVLKSGGAFLITESAFDGDLATDIDNPFAVIAYSSSLLYCLQENLAAGGPGHTSGDGPSWVTEALTAAGFGNIRITPSATGYNVISAIKD